MSRLLCVEPSRHSDTPREVQRHGFTLAELTVALVLLSVGLLGLASTSAFLAHEHAASGRAERAASVAGSRMERLHGGVCAASQGTEIVDGLTIAWSVTPTGPTAVASVRVSWAERGGHRTQHYTGGFPC